MDLHPLLSNLWADKWDLRKKYDGSNLGEKGFNYFNFIVQIILQVLGDTFVGKVIIWIPIKNLFAFQLGKN